MVSITERAPISQETSLTQRDIEQFKLDLVTPISPERKSSLESLYTDYYRRHIDEVESGDPEYFRATGEYPITTRYDALEPSEEKYEWLPEEMVVNALVERHLDAEMLLHPTRIKALRNVEEGGFEPSRGKVIPKLDELISSRIAVHSSEFGFHSLSEREAIDLGMKPESSGRKLIASDLWSWTTNDMVTSPIMTNSTPDMLSAHGLAMVALLQGRAFVPFDGIWNKLENQIVMFTRAIELLEQNPILQDHPDREYLLERSKRLIGITLKAKPDGLEEIVDKFRFHGGKEFRIYDPRQSTSNLQEATKIVRRGSSTDTIIVGNLMDVDDGLLMQEEGANGLTVVLFGGGICITSPTAKVAVENMRVAYEFAQNQNLKIPFIVDSGTGDTYIVLTAAGSSGFMKGQSILSGIEKQPYLRWQQTTDGRFLSMYSGEAAKRTKFLGGKVDRQGRPVFVEGEDTYVEFNHENSNVATSLYNLYQNLATGIIFARGESLESVRLNPTPQLVHMSQSSKDAGSSHHSPQDRNAI